MQDTITVSNRGGLAALISRARVEIPDLTATGSAVLASILLILAFPDFNLWPLAAVALVPLLLAIAWKPTPTRAFFLGWLTGSTFFYGSCHWLTYSMIHYGGLPSWLAYLLLIPGALVIGLFPAFFAVLLAMAIREWRANALLIAPFLWIAFEWARLGVTGQLWNALGYSQAYEPLLIQTARWGGVYAVSFLVVAVNSAIALVVVNRSRRAFILAGLVIVLVGLSIFLSHKTSPLTNAQSNAVRVFAIQPNVPMHLVKSLAELRVLTNRHLVMTQDALRQDTDDGTPRLVIWPESPMNFSYASDSQFRDLITRFARDNNVSVLFNSQEPAPDEGVYNSAMLVNDEGRLIGQYDKIRLMPFGEYVPFRRWLPGASLIPALVGDFKQGASYTLLPAGEMKAGVFICIESAYPWISRSFARGGADVLINISNDGYLGRTAVMRQHLANAVFRAVENGRPLLRVTNTGVTAFIDANGEVRGATEAFEPAVRVWTLARGGTRETFYMRNGDLFALFCSVVTVLVVAASLSKGLRATRQDLEKA